ncbi:glycosyltransferase family 4 protein [Shinella daejeonensis]|uniref:glycosyltransferase family 4 protein n=1 Tax=Shinella daejeonensis TaxID=659017 RepID=UPI0020C7806E|nr:glycosyltransferase family 4 protein [Shinella daejeonensis]MCP8896615.1 glycosyltransferase family 4 protein [Shinella daejeonensis]
MTGMHAPPPPARSAPLAVQVVRQYAPNRGGLEDVVRQLSGQLLARGFRVRVVTLDRLFSAPDRTLPARETIDGVEVVRIPFSGSRRYPLAPQVFRYIRDADIVHVHAVDFFFDALAWGWPLHRRPLVATTHGGFFHTAKFSGLKKIWFNTITRVSSLGYRGIVGCSAQDARTFATVAGRRVVHIDNGADTAKFADAGAPAPQRRLVTIGRFSVNKRLDRLFDAMTQLVAENADWHLDVVGVPGDHSLDDVAAMIAARGLRDRIGLHAGLPDAAVRDLLGKVSLFASASQYEGFGLVAVEAMSAGLMPLLHPNTAYADLAGNHPEIRLCDFSDARKAAADMTAAFALLEKDPAGYRRAAMTAAATYSWERVADRYLEVYHTILQDSRRRLPATGLAERGGRA